MNENESTAMNIVHQIGDTLYEALPQDVAHEHFVKARQATNDEAIDFATKLIKRDVDLAEARGIWFALRDIHHEWGLSAVSFCQSAVVSLGLTEDEIRAIDEHILDRECDGNDFYQIFKDSFGDLMEELGYGDEE